MSFQKHNLSRVTIPSGWCRNTLKNRLSSTRLRERERHLLRIVLDQADGFVLTVRWLCNASALTDKTWPKVRDALVAAGVLVADSKNQPEGYKVWHLFFDFTPIASGTLDQPSYPQRLPKEGDHARAHDPPRLGGSRDPAEPRGSRNPSKPGVSKPTIFSPQIPPQTASGGDFEKNRNAASEEQRKILDALVADSKGITHIAAWRLALARKAAEGKLTKPSPQPATEYQPPKRNKSLLGFIADCPRYGQIKVIERGEFATANGDLRGDDADQIWRRYEQGKLVFLPPSSIGVQ